MVLEVRKTKQEGRFILTAVQMLFLKGWTDMEQHYVTTGLMWARLGIKQRVKQQQVRLLPPLCLTCKAQSLNVLKLYFCFYFFTALISLVFTETLYIKVQGKTSKSLRQFVSLTLRNSLWLNSEGLKLSNETRAFLCRQN